MQSAPALSAMAWKRSVSRMFFESRFGGEGSAVLIHFCTEYASVAPSLRRSVAYKIVISKVAEEQAVFCFVPIHAKCMAGSGAARFHGCRSGVDIEARDRPRSMFFVCSLLNGCSEFSMVVYWP